MSLGTRLRLRTMRSLSRAASLGAAFALALGVNACSSEGTSSDSASLVGSNGAVTVEPGWLVIDWSIAGSSDVEQCDRSHSATVKLSVAAASGGPLSEFQRTCLALNATLTLPPGDYAADAVLLDGAGTNLTVPVALQPFEIASGIPSRTSLEFPSNTFYAR